MVYMIGIVDTDFNLMMSNNFFTSISSLFIFCCVIVSPTSWWTHLYIFSIDEQRKNRTRE
jgi:hypothetical protein